MSPAGDDPGFHGPRRLPVHIAWLYSCWNFKTAVLQYCAGRHVFAGMTLQLTAKLDRSVGNGLAYCLLSYVLGHASLHHANKRIGYPFPGRLIHCPSDSRWWHVFAFGRHAHVESPVFLRHAAPRPLRARRPNAGEQRYRTPGRTDAKTAVNLSR